MEMTKITKEFADELIALGESVRLDPSKRSEVVRKLRDVAFIQYGKGGLVHKGETEFIARYFDENLRWSNYPNGFNKEAAPTDNPYMYKTLIVGWMRGNDEGECQAIRGKDLEKLQKVMAEIK